MRCKLFRLAAIAAACTLAACGGGGGGETTTAPASVAAHPFADVSNAKQGGMIGDTRPTMVILAAAAETSITRDELFAWAEKIFPTLFPAGPSSTQLTFEGVVYTVRHYASTGNYLGITNDGRVFGYGTFTGNVLMGFGKITDYTCDVKPALCAPPTFAGNITVADDGGSMTVVPNYKGNLIWGLGADNKGFEIPVTNVDEVCFRSNRLGNWGQRGGPGCSKPEANGTLRVSRIANNDCGRVTIWDKAGKEYWLDLESATGYTVTGLNAKRSVCGFEYGKSGFRQSQISAVLEPNLTASVVLDFGSNYLSGFFSHDGKALALDPVRQQLVFVLHGPKAGQGFGPGWGIGINKDDKGNLIPPSVRWGWLEYKDDRYIVTIKNVACIDKGSITVHVGSGPADKVVYDPGTKGFGLGWIGLPGPDGVSVWKAGSGITFDQVNYQMGHGVPFCVPK